MIYPPRSMAVLLAALTLTTLAGCQPEGPARYDLSGTVTYKGQPVPGGEIHIAPDGAKGNTGPGSYAMIKNGRYETLPGKGTIGGPHVLTVICFANIPGEVAETDLKELCPPQRVEADLPSAAGSYDLDLKD